jgi:hypothetical protein
MHLLIMMFIAVLMTEGTIFISQVVVERKNLKKWTQHKTRKKTNEFAICELQIQRKLLGLL